MALDPALTQKKRARRRLLGALVLGVVAAVVLPLVLDSEPRQAITDVQVEIPPRDAPIPAKADEAPAPGADVAVVPPIEPAPPTPEKGASGASPAPERVAPAAPSANGAKSGAAGSSDARAPAAKSPPRPAQAPKPAAEAPKPATEVSKPDAAPASSGPTSAAAHFAVQVGAFANAGSARAQADKARKAGVRVYTETVKTAQGERTRVRVGPFTSREAADQARTRLKAIGIDSSVVPL
ncbi:MAG: hypothetical protein AMXMBFR52_25940 [Burkholderiales bacterium]